MITDANIWLVIYLLVGPLPWILLMLAMRLGRRKMMRLKRETYALSETPPQVTVIVPAKDEGAGIAECISRVLAMDYPRFDVIAVNDRSSDDTGAILDALSRESTKLRVVHIDQLPDGWLGKCNALHVATRDLQSDWLLFVDSDVAVEPKALRDTLAMSDWRKYDALSILTRLECHSFLERLVLPLAAGAWSIIFTVSTTNDDDEKETAAANGQFFLIRRTAYESVGGHESVRDRIVEDVELMRLLKSSGFCTRVYFGGHLASTRMHSNWRQMLHGWGRIYSGTARRKMGRIILAMLFLLVAGFSLYPALIYGIYAAIAHQNFLWLGAAAVHAFLIRFIVAKLYRGTGNLVRYTLGFPIGSAILLIFFTYALRLCRTGTITWRGTQFSMGPSSPAVSKVRSSPSGAAPVGLSAESRRRP